MQGELSNQAAVQRTQNYYDVIEAGKCAVKVNVIDQQTANWSRDQAQNLMTNWLSTGAAFDGVLANNDEMAHRRDPGDEGRRHRHGVGHRLAAWTRRRTRWPSMQAGELDITVFQNAAAQGGGALDAAVKLATGEAVEQKVYIPFELVTPGEHRRLPVEELSRLPGRHGGAARGAAPFLRRPAPTRSQLAN